MIQGGWEFVWAAYGMTFATLTLYAMSLIGRQRAQQRVKVGKGEP